jgi:hypothetical protein
MPIIEGTTRLKQVKGEYDFAVDGGAAGVLTLRAAVDDTLGTELPNGSVIEGGYIEVVTPVTSGGAATISADSEAAGDLQAAAAVSGAPWSTAGRKSITPAFTGATTIKTTAKRNIAITIAAATLTAGKFRVVLFVK